MIKNNASTEYNSEKAKHPKKNCILIKKYKKMSSQWDLHNIFNNNVLVVNFGDEKNNNIENKKIANFFNSDNSCMIQKEAQNYKNKNNFNKKDRPKEKNNKNNKKKKRNNKKS